MQSLPFHCIAAFVKCERAGKVEMIAKHAGSIRPNLLANSTFRRMRDLLRNARTAQTCRLLEQERAMKLKAVLTAALLLAPTARNREGKFALKYLPSQRWR